MKTNLTESEQFKVLWGFFTSYGTEVEARGSEELLPEQKAALVQLACGKADNATRDGLIPLLRSNRNALSFLGEQIKLKRPSAVPRPSRGRSRASRSKKS
jgi:hypothetical protein